LLQVRYIEKIWDAENKKWLIQDDEGKGAGPEAKNENKYDEWAGHALVVRRKILRIENGDDIETTRLLIRSDPLRNALREVLGELPGIFWTREILKVSPPATPYINAHRLTVRPTTTAGISPKNPRRSVDSF
jgi:hypothetical protein